MLKILITVPGASFEYQGDGPLPDVRPLIDQWYGAVTDPDGKIRELTARLSDSTAALLKAEQADAGKQTTQ